MDAVKTVIETCIVLYTLGFHKNKGRFLSCANQRRKNTHNYGGGGMEERHLAEMLNQLKDG